MDIGRRIEALQKAGWEADADGVGPAMDLEALVHEVAHNAVLGSLVPNGMAGTARLISNRGLGLQSDLDEILVTAITIQLLETRYLVLGATDDSMLSVTINVSSPTLRKSAQDLVIEALNTPPVTRHCEALFSYIEGLLETP